MDLRQLKRFVAVADAHSFNKAAEILAVSQPSLTRSIQLLEESLETKLLERGPRGIFLTPMGEELLPYARIILNERDRAIASLNSLRSQNGETISIGAEDSFNVRRLPLALTQLVASHPEVTVKVVEGEFREILDGVREGSVDVALGARAPYLDLNGIIFEPLADEGAAILVRAGHPLLQKDKPTREDLLKAQWIVSSHPAVISGWADIFERWGAPQPPVSLYTSSVHIIRECLLNGDFVAIGNLSAYAREIESGRLAPLDLGEPRYHRPVGVFRRGGAKLSRTARAFIELIRRICDGDAQAAA